MKDDGFEFKLPGEPDATFFRWSVSDGGKDVMLIDAFTKLPLHEFFAIVEDSFDRSRGPILLAMIATSIRAKRPDWTPERIIRTVQNLSLSEITFIDGDEDDDAGPPPQAEKASTGEKSSAESSPSATQAKS